MKLERKKLDINKYDSWFDFLKSTIDKKGYKIIFVSDCDGILTDGRSYFNTEKTHKSYGSYDKEAINFITKYMDDTIYFISDDKIGYKITESRIKHLNNSCKGDIELLNKSPKERKKLIEDIREIEDLSFNKKYIIVFLGDSLSDIPALSIADIAMTTNNAPDEVKEYCNYSSKYNGGMGGFADCIFHFYEYFNEIINYMFN